MKCVREVIQVLLMLKNTGPMEQERKRCMLCGKSMILKAGICDPCRDRVRREAMGEQADIRTKAEMELKKHGVNPDQTEKKKG